MEQNILQAKNQIEEVFTKMGIDVPVYDLSNRYAWFLRMGSANITIQLTKENHPRGADILTVFAPLLRFIPQNESLLLDLLHWHLQYVGVAFGIQKDGIFLKSERECTGLDHEEAFLMLHRVGHLTNHFKQLLEEQYNLKDYSHKHII
jgi:hypothetical protein